MDVPSCNLCKKPSSQCVAHGGLPLSEVITGIHSGKKTHRKYVFSISTARASQDIQPEMEAAFEKAVNEAEMAGGGYYSSVIKKAAFVASELGAMPEKSPVPLECGCQWILREGGMGTHFYTLPPNDKKKCVTADDLRWAHQGKDDVMLVRIVCYGLLLQKIVSASKSRLRQPITAWKVGLGPNSKRPAVVSKEPLPQEDGPAKGELDASLMRQNYRPPNLLESKKRLKLAGNSVTVKPFQYVHVSEDSVETSSLAQSQYSPYSVWRHISDDSNRLALLSACGEPPKPAGPLEFSMHSLEELLAELNVDGKIAEALGKLHSSLKTYGIVSSTPELCAKRWAQHCDELDPCGDCRGVLRHFQRIEAFLFSLHKFWKDEEGRSSSREAITPMMLKLAPVMKLFLIVSRANIVTRQKKPWFSNSDFHSAFRESVASPVTVEDQLIDLILEMTKSCGYVDDELQRLCEPMVR